jgi:hypothetical protein
LLLLLFITVKENLVLANPTQMHKKAGYVITVGFFPQVP